MYVHESGSSENPLLVFLHGNGASGLMWQAHLAQLTEYHCLAPDFPGFGRSNHREWVSLAQSADEIAALIRERAGAGRAHIVGLSLGGATALTLLGRAPEVVDHAVIDGAGAFPPAGLPLISAGFRLAQPFLRSDPVIKIVARQMKVPDSDYQEFRQGMKNMSPRSFRRSFVQALSQRQPPGLERLTNPVLFVAGERELKGLLQSNAILAQALPQGECRVAPARGHGWLAEAPALHIEMVRAWLRDEPLPAELARCGAV